MRSRSVIFLLAALAIGACDREEQSPIRATYEVEVAGQESFRIGLVDDEQIAAAESMRTEGRRGIVHGRVRRGDGGFNDPYSWHLDPASVTFPDLAIEACDGRPHSDVERDVDYWVDNLMFYCPWGSRIVRRLDQ